MIACNLYRSILVDSDQLRVFIIRLLMYTTALLVKTNGVTNKDMAPHQPKKRVIYVYCQKTFDIHCLHICPVADLWKNKMIAPI